MHTFITYLKNNLFLLLTFVLNYGILYYRKEIKDMDYYETYDCHIPLNAEERAKFNFLVNSHHMTVDEAYRIIEEEHQSRFRKENKDEKA